MARRKEISLEESLKNSKSYIIVNHGTPDEYVIPFSSATPEIKQALIGRAGKALEDYYNSPCNYDETADYLAFRRREAMTNLINAVSALDKHLNVT